jgi:hypothetical protein
MKSANKRMVLTLPVRRSFYIRARYTRLGGSVGCVLPVKARAGRTCEALALFSNVLECMLGSLLMDSLGAYTMPGIRLSHGFINGVRMSIISSIYTKGV